MPSTDYWFMQKNTCNNADCFLCNSCMPEWKDLIGIKKTTFQFKKSEQIFSAGDKVEGIYFMYSGSVKVHKEWGEQKELIIRFAKKGDILGHRGLGGDAIYPISATALEDVKVCFIDNDFLEATLKSNNSFTYKLMQFYSIELQKAEKRMRNLALMDVNARIADALLDIKEILGVNSDNYISVPVARRDIASYAGTIYETVFKFLTELTKKKIITTSGKSIRINNDEKLKQFIKTKG
jgi:CRP/FNR family transcriptional regulator